MLPWARDYNRTQRRKIMKMPTLDILLEEELKDIYSAEKQLLKALPKLAKRASSPELKSALEEHVQVTKRQTERLEQVFEELGKSAKAKTCEAMKGLIEEAEDMLSEDAADSVMDAAIIGCAQKVEHYEIASYGTVKTWAERVGQDRAARLLDETLQEEGEADKRLTGIAESMVNEEASSGGSGSESRGNSRSKKSSRGGRR
jgi:ferritin-like metal-binding protein YciE